jgi:DNA recombination protein RmuC
MIIALSTLLGIGVGFGIGWLFRAARPATTDSRIENELRDQLRAREVDLTQVRDKAVELGNARAGAEAARVAAENTLQEQRQTQQTTLQTLSSELRTEREQVAVLNKANSELEARTKYLTEQLKSEAEVQEKFHQGFKAISDELLLQNSSRFNQQSSENLAKVLNPLKETIGLFQTSLDASRTEATTHSALLKDQINRIGTEASNLVKALKGDVKTLGTWGENMLDQILEKSGLQNGIHYRRQSGEKDTAGKQRYLDVIVELPDHRNLIIDSKVSLRAYETAVNCTDETERLAALDEHIEAVRKHFRELGAKRYQDIHGINTPDFVLMYVPIEAAFFAAVAQEPNLFADALEEHVVLITNSTLLATLRTVAHVWRLADQQKNAEEIAARGGILYGKFCGFIADLQNVGQHITKSRASWEDAMDKLSTGHGNLIRQVEMLKTLRVKTDNSLPSELVAKAIQSDADGATALPPVERV